MPLKLHANPLCVLVSFRDPYAVSHAVRKMRLCRRTFCRESTSLNASKLAAGGRCFPSPAMPKTFPGAGNAIADGRYYVE